MSSVPKGVYERVRSKPMETRFWEKVALPSGTFGCMEWLGSRDKNGYGRFGANDEALGGPQVWNAHRVAWTLLNGPIPDGLQIDHLCRNRGCVRVEHLEPVTQRENIVRGDGYAGQARKTHCKHGHSLADALIHHGRRTCRECNRIRCAERKARRG